LSYMAKDQIGGVKGLFLVHVHDSLIPDWPPSYLAEKFKQIFCLLRICLMSSQDDVFRVFRRVDRHSVMAIGVGVLLVSHHVLWLNEHIELLKLFDCQREIIRADRYL
jgi:hypothetical protein